MNLIDKDSTEPFEGWVNHSGISKDDIILTSILQRKATFGPLPPLHDMKIRNSSQQHIHAYLKLQPVRVKHLSTKQKNKKEARLKTEGFNQFYGDAISPLKKKLVEILNQQQTKQTPQPIIQEQLPENRSQVPSFKVKPNQEQNFYTKYKISPNSSEQKQQECIQTLEQSKEKEMDGNVMKKSQTKTFMKLNALQMLSDFKKNIYRQAASIHNLTSKNRFVQEHPPKAKTKTHKNIFAKKYQIQQKVVKVGQKLKQTFVKFDIFEKEKKKKQKLEKLEMLTQFNDQQIFSMSPQKIEKIQTRRVSPLKTIQRGSSSKQDIAVPFKVRKNNSPHRYKFTIN